MARLDKADIYLKLKKCVFLQEVGGSSGTSDKPKRNTTAIHEAPAPTNVKELQAFVEMFNYYACHLPSLPAILASLHELLPKDCKWTWGKRQVEAFNQAESMLNPSDLLVHYDPSKDLLHSCDASPYELEAVLSHIIDGREKPILYASKTRSSDKRNCAQLNKEGAGTNSPFWVCLRQTKLWQRWRPREFNSGLYF